MTAQKTEIELAKAAMVKAIRSAVRLKHSLAADAELNEILPDAEEQFDAAVNAGVLPTAEEMVTRALGDGA